jgi:hypothetical protein
LHRDSLITFRLAVSMVAAVPVQPARALAGTLRTFAFETVFSDLNACLKTRISAEMQSQI